MTNAQKIIPFAPFTFRAWEEIDLAAIPRLRFVYSDFYAAGYLSVSFAAPKTGKSLLALCEAIDAATGRGILTGRPTDPIKVLYYNAEDDLAVMQSRVAAVLHHWGIPQSEIVGRFHYESGVGSQNPVVLIKGKEPEIVEPAFRCIEDMLRREGITLAVFDPLQDLSRASEDNEVFRALGGRIRALASVTGAAIGLVHHTRKPSPGIAQTLDDGRGGSALRGVARFNRLLVPMAESEGAQAGVDDFRNFFRIGEAESNLAPPSSDRNRWFEKVGERIANGANIATIRPWAWPDHFAGVTVNDACKVRAAIAARDPAPRENAQATDWAGNVVAEVLGLDLGKKGDKARISTMLRTWLQTGVLARENLPIGKNRKSVPCIAIGPNDPAESLD